MLVTVTHRDPQRGRALGQHARRRLHRADRSRRASSRRARRTSGCRSGWPATQKSMREAQDRLFQSYQTQDLFVPEGSVSAVTHARSPSCNEDHVEAQAPAHRARGGAQAGRPRCGRRGQSLDTRAAGGRRRGRRGPQRASSRRSRLELVAAQGEVQGGAPRGAEGPGADRAAQEGAGRRAPARSWAALQAEYAQLQKREAELARRDRRPEGAGRQPEPQGRRARGAARRRRSPPRASTRSCCRSSTRPTSRPPSAATT